MPTGLKSSPDDFDLRMSEDARPFYNQVVDFLERVVDPMQKQFFKAADPNNRWGYTSEQLELLEGHAALRRDARHVVQHHQVIVGGEFHRPAQAAVVAGGSAFEEVNAHVGVPFAFGVPHHRCSHLYGTPISCPQQSGRSLSLIVSVSLLRIALHQPRLQHSTDNLQARMAWDSLLHMHCNNVKTVMTMY